MTGASRTGWALGLEARSRALISDPNVAEPLYLEAIDRLGRTLVRTELARTRLLYGEWLRRRGRRVDAREQLRAAHDLFTTIGAHAFAERARRELVATGEKARKRTVATEVHLTGREVQVARLALRWPDQSRDRYSAVGESAHRRVPPRKCLRQARHHLASRARPSLTGSSAHAEG